jgi:hypothetical protein
MPLSRADTDAEGSVPQEVSAAQQRGVAETRH